MTYNKKYVLDLAGVAQLVGHRSAKQKVTGSIPVRAHACVAGLVPSQSVCERQLTKTN